MTPSPTWRILGLPSTLFLVLFVPGHMADWAVEWLWLAGQLAIALAWFLVLRGPLRPVAGIRPALWTGLFLLVTAATCWSMLYSVFALDMKIGLSDIPYMLRFLIFIPLALFVGSTADETLGDDIARALKMVVLFNLFAVVVLLARLPLLFDAMLFVYEGAKVHYDFGYVRIGIPFTNPNYAALVFILAMAYFAFFKRSPLFFGLALASLFFTGSRSGLLSAMPILVVAYFMLLGRALKNARVAIVLLILHAALFTVAAQVVDAAADWRRLIELTDALQAGDLAQVDTASIRFDVVREAMAMIGKSPLFGIGPGRSYGFDITDSQLVAWPLLFGVPLALLVSVFFAWIFFGGAFRARTPVLRWGMCATALAFLLMLTTGDFMKNYRLFFIVVLVAHGMRAIVERHRAGAIAVDSKADPLPGLAPLAH